VLIFIAFLVLGALAGREAWRRLMQRSEQIEREREHRD
jgi:hypothetical protein